MKTDSEKDNALLQQKLLAKFSPPSPRDLRFLQEWMERPTMGKVYLLGRDSETWTTANARDLVTVKHRGDEDPFSGWVMDCVVHVWHRLLGRHFRVCEF